MSVFVIIVSHNAKPWIVKCLRSLQNSSIKANIVVVDNGSTDETCEVVKQNFPTVSLIEQGQNLGFGVANNIGLSLAHHRGGNYFFLINQDVYVHKDAIANLIEFAEKYPDYGIITPIHLNGDGTDLDFNFKHYLSHGNCPDFLSNLYFNTLREYHEIGFANAAAWLITKKCLERVGGFNPVFHMYGEDDNFIHRVRYHKLKVALLPKAKIFHDRINSGPRKNQTYISNLTMYSDPSNDLDIETEIELVKRQLSKNLILFRFKRAKYFKTKLIALKKFPQNVVTNKLLSRNVGPTFLNTKIDN